MVSLVTVTGIRTDFTSTPNHLYNKPNGDEHPSHVTENTTSIILHHVLLLYC